MERLLEENIVPGLNPVLLDQANYIECLPPATAPYTVQPTTTTSFLFFVVVWPGKVISLVGSMNEKNLSY